MCRLPPIMAVIAAVLAIAGCGGGERSSGDGTANVPDTGGLRDKGRGAAAPAKGDFPAVDGRSLQQGADSMQGGPEGGPARQTFTLGPDPPPVRGTHPPGQI